MAEKTAWDISLNEKLMRIQTELKAPKNLYNSFGKYKYRNAEGIQEALKPLLKAYGVNVTISDSIEEIGGRVYVKSTVILTDCYTKESVISTAYAREAEAKKGMDEAQVTGATSSYARKYALNGLFLLDDTEDVDSEAYQAQVKAQGKKEQTPEAKPAPKATTPAPAQDSRVMLRTFIKDNGLDAKVIAQACGLNKESTDEDFQMALVYAKNLVGGNT